VDREPLAVPALTIPEPLDGERVVARVGTAEPAAEGRARRVVVHDEGRAATSQHPLELAQPGLAAGAEEVRPPRVGHVDAVVRERQGLCDALDDPGAGHGGDPLAREVHERWVRFDAHHARAAEADEARQVETAAAAHVDQVGAPEGVDGVHRGLDDALAVDAEVLDLVDVGGVPDVGAAGRRVWRAPAVPCLAGHRRRRASSAARVAGWTSNGNILRE
jgi:hypothetical protein